jgi:hypothetical protein
MQMSRTSAQGMRAHLRERNNMDGGNRISGRDSQKCARNHSELKDRFEYCPDCGKEVGDNQ